MSGQLDQCVVDVKYLNWKAEFWWSKSLWLLCMDENNFIMCKMEGDKTPPFFQVKIKLSDVMNILMQLDEIFPSRLCTCILLIESYF